MSEVDLICDDTQQANSKLISVKALLAEIGALSGGTSSLERKKKIKSKKPASDSSPVLHTSRPSVPMWMRLHECEDTETCYSCWLAPALSVAVVKYFNLRAQCLHIQSNIEDAYEYFDESLKVLGLVAERLKRCKEESFEHKKDLLETLHLQVNHSRTMSRGSLNLT